MMVSVFRFMKTRHNFFVVHIAIAMCVFFWCTPSAVNAQLAQEKNTVESGLNGGIDGGPGDRKETGDGDETDLDREKYRPSKMSATAQNTHSVVLTWNDRAKDEDGYQIYRMGASGRWERIALIGRSTERFIDRTVASGVLYTYRVRAYNQSSKSKYSSEVSVRVPEEKPVPLQGGADDVLNPQTATEGDVLDHLQKGDLTPDTVDDSVAEKAYECNVNMIPTKELDAYVAGECEAQIAEARQMIRTEFGDKLAKVEAKEKMPPLWQQIYHSGTARIVASAGLLLIILNNVFWHMTHRSTKKRLG